MSAAANASAVCFVTTAELLEYLAERGSAAARFHGKIGVVSSIDLKNWIRSARFDAFITR